MGNSAQKFPPTHPDIHQIPQHVAIIMDGNGRWAKSRGMPRVAGHKKGADTLKALLEGAAELGIRYMTLYAFSSENWQRPTGEVSELMALLKHYLRHEIDTLHKNGIRLKVIGDPSKLEGDIRESIEAAEALTKNNDKFHLNVALSYGGRQEIVRAARSIAEDVKQGTLSAEAIDETLLGQRLDTLHIPDPDLLIRTGGEQRLSNFLLWQSAYTELYFTPVLWPDFTPEHLKEAIDDYARRERRYGNASE